MVCHCKAAPKTLACHLFALYRSSQSLSSFHLTFFLLIRPCCFPINSEGLSSQLRDHEDRILRINATWAAVIVPIIDRKHKPVTFLYSHWLR